MAGRIELLDFDPLTGGTTHVHFDEDGEGFAIVNSTDVTAVAELAQYERNQLRARTHWKDNGNHVARIPTDISLREIVQAGRSEKDFLRWLDDKDQGALWKTRPGRLI